MSEILWGDGDSDRPLRAELDDYFEEILDQADRDFIVGNNEVTALAYKRVEVESCWLRPLERLLEELDDEYGGDDPTDPTEAMKQAEKAFLDAVLADYQTWRCEPTGGTVTVKALDWVREHRPDWMEEIYRDGDSAEVEIPR